MNKSRFFLLILSLSLMAFQACKKTDEPLPKGVFSIYQLGGTGRVTAHGSQIDLLEAFVRDDGDVPGQITAIVLKISRDSASLMEISLENYSAFGLKIDQLAQAIQAGGTGGIAYSHVSSFYMPQWSAYPNKVEAILYITDGNGYTHEIHQTGIFTATYDPRV